MKPIIRIPLAMLVTSAVICVGLIGVHASEQCVRLIQHKRHHVSAATAARWAAWDKAHPNWHPKPVHEAMAAIDFACSIPLIQKPVDGELPLLNLQGFDFAMNELPPPVPPNLIAKNEPPPTIFPDTPGLPLVSPPIYSPEYPTLFGGFPPPHTAPPTVTPEPSTWMLLATSLLAMAALAKRRPVLRRAVARGERRC
jgi:hypothetical protein